MTVDTANPTQQTPEDNGLKMSERVVNALQPHVPNAAEVKEAALRKLESDAKEYAFLKGVEEEAKAKALALKPGIMATLTKYGTVPDTAPKSRRIETPGYICTITTGTSTEIDDDAVTAFMQLLGKTKKLREMFLLVFRPRVEYSLQPTARDTILHGRWPKSIKEQVHVAYMRCISAKTSAPSLSVDSKAEIAERQRIAEEEAAAKALAAASKKRGKVAA